jgi:hypothetical protein
MKTTDLKPQLYKKEASLQKFQTSNKNTCGALDTEVYYDVNSSELKVSLKVLLLVVVPRCCCDCSLLLLVVMVLLLLLLLLLLSYRCGCG